MGVCSSQNQKKKSTQSATLTQQQPYQEQVNPINTSQINFIQKEGQQSLQQGQYDQNENQWVDQGQFNDDIYVKNIMSSFDNINQLFNQMAEEFDKLSKYLLSGSDQEALL